MKITNLSIAAIAAMVMVSGANADAVSNLKVDGQAKLWYETNDKDPNDGLFDREASSGDLALRLGASADLGPVQIGLQNYTVTTTGLENSIVAASRHSGIDNQNWMGEAFLATKVGNTTFKVGRQSLNTPFAFTENWNAVPNTFEAAVAINNDIKDTTIILAQVAKGNGYGDAGWKVAHGGEFTDLDATMLAVSTKAIPMVPLNAYYYDVNNIAAAGVAEVEAYWVDASVNVGPAKLTGIYAGAKAGRVSALGDEQEIDAVALSASTEFSGVSLMGAYSKVSSAQNSALAIANVGTGFKKTKLPTAGVYTDGLYVAQQSAEAFKVKAATKLAGFGLAAQYINNDSAVASKQTQEFDFIVSRNIGDNAAVKAIFLNRAFDDSATDDVAGGNHFRVIGTYNF